MAVTIVELASFSKADFIRIIQEFKEAAPAFEQNLRLYTTVQVPGPIALVCHSLQTLC